MTLYRNQYRVESTRLRDWDYATPGAYFVTICAKNRECIFGNIVEGVMSLNDAGKIVLDAWFDLSHHYPHIILDAFVVMPNHIHGIIFIAPNSGSSTVETGLRPVSTNYTRENLKFGQKTKIHNLSEIVRALKSFSARRINEIRKSSDKTVWQCRFFDHIIRDHEALQKIRQYIANNPLNWKTDDYFS